MGWVGSLFLRWERNLVSLCDTVSVLSQPVLRTCCLATRSQFAPANLSEMSFLMAVVANHILAVQACRKQYLVGEVINCCHEGGLGACPPRKIYNFRHSKIASGAMLERKSKSCLTRCQTQKCTHSLNICAFSDSTSLP